MSVCPNFSNSCDLEAVFLVNFLISRDLRGLKEIKANVAKNSLSEHLWVQTDEKKLDLVWRYKSCEIKFVSERSSQQGIKGL